MDRITAGRLDARVVLVISNNSESGALERARRAGVPWRHISAKTHPGPGAEDAAITAAIQQARADLVVLAGYMKKLGPSLLGTYRGRILNIHPALLPAYGGAGMFGIHPHEAVLTAGEAESGATVHLVTADYDRGPILGQRRVPVMPGDTPETLQKRVLTVEHEIYAEVLQGIAEGRIELPGAE